MSRPEFNAEIIARLRRSGDAHQLHAAQRIEELEQLAFGVAELCPMRLPYDALKLIKRAKELSL